VERQIDLNSLLLFYEVVEAGSLTAASIRLKLAKSTVSRRLTRLEHQFNSILLKKGTHKLALTEVGATLHKHCRQIVLEVQHATRQALSVHSDMQGPLRVAVPGDLGVTWLGAVVSDFLRLFPEITVAIQVHNSDIVDPTEEPFDIAVQIGETRPSRTVCKHLATLTRGIYASPEYLARRGTPQSPVECRSHDWIVTDVQERDGVWLFRKQSKGRAIGVGRKIVANSARLSRELAIAGQGLALIPDALCTDAVRDHRLARILGHWKTPPLQVVALFLSRDRIPKKTRAFLDLLAEKTKALTRA